MAVVAATSCSLGIIAYLSGDLNGDGCIGHGNLGIVLTDWECGT